MKPTGFDSFMGIIVPLYTQKPSALRNYLTKSLK